MLQRGLLIVVSGPSGSGKSTLLNELRSTTPGVKFSVSATTRAPRENEYEGKNYFFKSIDEFEAMINNNEFIEWTTYCDNYYGTPRKYVEDCLESGFDVVLEIEVTGNKNIKQLYPDCVSIFILPPTYQELERRIRKRGTEGESVIRRRLDTAKKEMLCIDEYDYVIINSDIHKANNDIKSIIKAEKLKVERNQNILKTIGLI